MVGMPPAPLSANKIHVAQALKSFTFKIVLIELNLGRTYINIVHFKNMLH